MDILTDQRSRLRDSVRVVRTVLLFCLCTADSICLCDTDIFVMVLYSIFGM